jgi:hypothetical protein
MDTELLRIVAGRAKYIEMGYQKGAFDSMKRTIKAFPNLLRDIGLDMPAPPDEAVA